MAASYCVSAFMDCTIAAARGIGKTVVPTVAVIMGSCCVPDHMDLYGFAYFRTIPSAVSLYVFSWLGTAVFEIIYFVRTFRQLPWLRWRRSMPKADLAKTKALLSWTEGLF